MDSDDVENLEPGPSPPKKQKKTDFETVEEYVDSWWDDRSSIGSEPSNDAPPSPLSPESATLQQDQGGYTPQHYEPNILPSPSISSSSFGGSESPGDEVDSPTTRFRDFRTSLIDSLTHTDFSIRRDLQESLDRQGWPTKLASHETWHSPDVEYKPHMVDGKKVYPEWPAQDEKALMCILREREIVVKYGSMTVWEKFFPEREEGDVHQKIMEGLFGINDGYDKNLTE